MKKLLLHTTDLALKIGLTLAFTLGGVGVVLGQTTLARFQLNGDLIVSSDNAVGTPSATNNGMTFSTNNVCQGSGHLYGDANTDYLDIFINLSGFNNITVSWTQRRNTNGSGDNSWNFSGDYDNDGSVDYTITNNANVTTTCATLTLTLPSSFTYQSNVKLRFQRNGSGSRTTYIDDIYVRGTNCVLSTAPISITGTSSICLGGSTILTTSGGSLGTDAKDVWYEGTCATEAYTNEWATQPFATPNTTVNSVAGGILNVTSVNNDPMIDMAGLGSFDPNMYRYVQISYQVTSGIGSYAEIFFYNTTHNYAVGGEEVTDALISDGAWHFLNFDMWSDPEYKTGGNITGWRFDWAGESGVTMNIDFTTLANQPLIGLGTSVSVSPTAPATYFTRKKGACNSTVCVSRLVTVIAAVTPLVSITTDPGNTVCAGKNVSFTATPTNGGTTPLYQWKLNGSNVGTDSPTYNNTSLANGNQVSCVLTSNAACVSPATATSNLIIMTVNALPSFTVAKTDITCFNAGDGTITINASGGSGSGYQYRIYNGTSWTDWQPGNVFGSRGPGQYTIEIKDGIGCAGQTQ